METKKYNYSTGQTLFDACSLLCSMLIAYIGIINDQPTYKSWLLFCAILLVIGSRFAYLTITYFIPCFKNKTALELDNYKLQFFIKGALLFQTPREVALWTDIADREYTPRPRGAAIVGFKMNDGSSFGFRLTYIAGADKDIYNDIMRYYQNGKQDFVDASKADKRRL